MSTVMDARVVISAEDKTAAAFAAIKKHLDELTRASRSASGFPSNIGSQLDQTARAIRNQRDYTREIERTSAAHRRAINDHGELMRVHKSGFFSKHGAGSMLYGAAAGYVGVHGAVHGARTAIEKGAERQHVRVGAQNAGIGTEELGRLEAASAAARKGAQNLSTTEILELAKEARSAVQHSEEVFHLLPDLAKAASILKGSGVSNANIADLVKGGESLGLMNDPRRFHAYLEGQVKAMNVMGKTISTEQIYEAAKYSKAAGATLSDRFLNTALPSLIQEMHGSSAGDALSMMTKTFRGGMQHKHLPVERLNELGLLEDPSKIRRAKKTGQILGYAGKVKGDALLASDPDRWIQEYLKPAAARKGLTGLADLTKLLSEVLPSTAANLARIFLTQEETLKNHAKLYENAPGLDHASQNQRRDPVSGMKALSAAFDDLASAVTRPHMESVARGLDTVSEGVRSLAHLADEYPKAATTIAGAGALAAGLGAFNAAIKGLAAFDTLAAGSSGLAGVAASSGARWAMLSRFGLYGGAVGAGIMGAEGLQAIGSVAAGKFWTPKDLSALNDLRQQLDEVEQRMKAIRETSKMPEVRDMLLAPLASKAADLRNRIAQREETGAANRIVWTDAMNQFPIVAGTLGRGFIAGGRIPVTGAGLPGGSAEIGHIPAGGFFPAPGSATPASPQGDMARALNVTVEGVVRGEGVLTVNAGSELISLASQVRMALQGGLNGGSTGRSSPDAAPGAQMGRSE